MPLYLYQVSYTPEAWANLAKKPQDRARAIRPIVKQFKGKLVSFYFSFGEYDIVAIAEMPNNEAAAAFSVMALAGGAVKAIKTTPLMTANQGMQVMRQAGRASYQPPS